MTVKKFVNKFYSMAYSRGLKADVTFTHFLDVLNSAFGLKPPVGLDKSLMDELSELIKDYLTLVQRGPDFYDYLGEIHMELSYKFDARCLGQYFSAPDNYRHLFCDFGYGL